MAITKDTLVRGHQFAGQTGLKSGADLEDLVTEATLADGSELVDQETIETFLCPTLAVYRARVVNNGMGPAVSLAAGSFVDGSTISWAGGSANFANMLDGSDSTKTAEGTVASGGNGYLYYDLGAVYQGWIVALVEIKSAGASNHAACSPLFGFDAAGQITDFATTADNANGWYETVRRRGTTYLKGTMRAPFRAQFVGLGFNPTGADMYVQVYRFDVYGVQE